MIIKSNIYQIIMILLLINLLIYSSYSQQANRRNLLTAVKNGNNKYQLSDGTTYKWCEEYSAAISGTPPDGLYEEKDKPSSYMYCQFSSTSWDVQKEYQIIFRRMDASFEWETTTWNQFKGFQGTSTTFWTGMDYIHDKCGASGQCEMVQLMTAKAGGSKYSLKIEDFYVDNEAANFRGHFNNRCGATILDRTHDNLPLTTIDRDNDTSTTSNCAISYKGPWYYTACHGQNPFGPYNISGAGGFSWSGLNGTPDPSNATYQNLSYIAWGIRKFNNGGDYKTFALRRYTASGYCKLCDVKVCATCNTTATTCDIPCNTNCSNIGCTETGACTGCVNTFFYLDSGSCLPCNNSLCATCSSATICILPCNSNCGASGCTQTGKCTDCVAGYHLTYSGICQNIITAEKNGDDKYTLSDRRTFNWCEEYSAVIPGTLPTGLYVEKDNPTSYMYCSFDNSNWGVSKEYQIIFRRMDGSFSWDGTTWNQFKAFQGNSNDYWVGMNYIQNKCGTSGSCEMVYMLTTKTDNQFRSLSVQDYYFENEANNFRSHFVNSCGENIVTSRMSGHSNKPLTTTDRDNDTHAGNCADSYQAPWYYTACHSQNPFGPWDKVGANGISFNGANGTEDTGGNISFQNLKYIAWGIRKYNNSGDFAIYRQNNPREYTNGLQCLSCDVTVCATCQTDDVTCIIPCNTNCSNVGCTVTGDCVACVNNFFYFDSGSCIPCDNSKCATCTSANTCILACNSNCGASGCTQTGTCTDCIDGYYLSAGSCVRCDSPCDFCSQSGVLNCSKCLTNYYLKSSQCKICSDWKTGCDTCLDADTCTNCIDGYYLSSSSCSLCTSPCRFCSGGNTSQCTSCVTNYYLKSNECKVCSDWKPNCLACTDADICTSCANGYFLQSGSCVICSSPCEYCDISATNCSSCITNYHLKSNQCKVCSDWKSVNCLSCTNADTCTSCADSYYVDSGSCLDCPDPCQNCNSVNSCTSCISGFYLGGSECKICSDWKSNCTGCDDYQTCNQCAIGYYLDSGSCLLCQSPCINCSSLNQCDSCIANQYLSGNTCDTCGNWISNCIDCTAHNLCTTCDSGYYNDSNTSCPACVSPCQTCTSSQLCLTCVVTHLLGGNECKICSEWKGSDCLSCSDFQTCTSCGGTSYLESGSCQDCQSPCSECTSLTSCSSCLPGFLQSGDECKTCQDWKGAECLSCSDFETCTQCSDGFFLSGSDCLPCSYQCSKCNLTSDTCKECSDLNNRIDDSQCTCKYGFFDNGSDSACVECQYPCSDCSNESTCVTCLENNRSAPFCECSEGFYDAGQSLGCQACSANCKSCSKSADDCQQCSVGMNRNGLVPDCRCEPGYFEISKNNPHCQSCPTNCSECNNNGICTKCTNIQYIVPKCNSSRQFYNSLDSNGAQIQLECQPKCLTCSKNSDNCDSCASGLNRQTLPPYCVCKDGYHDSNQTLRDCIKCPQSCQNCIDKNTCTSCRSEEHRQLNEFSNNCDCIDGYKEQKNSQTCLKCYTYQGECYNECPLSTVVDEKLFVCFDKKIIQESHTTIIFVCLGGILLAYFLFGTQLSLCLKKSSKKPQIIKNTQEVVDLKNINKPVSLKVDQQDLNNQSSQIILQKSENQNRDRLGNQISQIDEEQYDNISQIIDVINQDQF